MKKLFTLMFFATMLFSSGFAQTCDTLFNLQSQLDTPTIYYVSPHPDSGYVSGNNIYGDLIKAEGFGAIAGDTVFSAVLYFGVVNINPLDSDNAIEIGVWDNSGTSYYGIPGAPGNLFDTAYITLRQIAQVITESYNTQNFLGVPVNFTTPIPIPTDTIYVGVYLPTRGGDTVALYTNIVPPGPDGNGWEYESDDSWGSYNDDFGFTGGSLGNYITVDICGATGTGINTPTDNAAVKIFPNPANDQINVEWSLNDAAEVAIYDVTGQLLRTFTVQGAALNTFGIQDLAPGTYIIRLTDRQTSRQQSQLFIKL